MARVTGDLIAATHFNTVVDSFNELWQDPKSGGSIVVYSYDGNHTTDTQRRKGWGNSDMSAGATVSGIVLADHYNVLAAHINTAEYHRVDASYTSHTHVATGQDVLAADLDPLVAVINGYTVTPTGTAFDLGADATLTPQVVSVSNGGAQWGTGDDPSVPATSNTRGTLTSELTFTWANYTDARHFFNSGGKCILDLEAVGGTNGATEWDLAFDQIDSIYFGAKTTYRGGTNGIGAKSFYELTTSYQQIFNAVGFDTSLYGGNYAGQGSGYSTYGGREVTVNAKLEEVSGSIVLTLQVILTEDPDDEFKVDCNITLYGGHKYAAISPNTSYMATSSGNKHKVGGVSYLFEDKSTKAPAIAQGSAWTYAAP